MTEGAVLAPHGRLAVRFPVRSSQPEPFGSEAVVDDGPTRPSRKPGHKARSFGPARSTRAACLAARQALLGIACPVWPC